MSRSGAYLDILPPVATERTRALGEVDFLVRERVTERILLRHITLIAVESHSRKRVLCVFDLRIVR